MLSQHTVLFPCSDRTERPLLRWSCKTQLTDARGEVEFIWLKYVIPEPEGAQGAPVLRFVT